MSVFKHKVLLSKDGQVSYKRSVVFNIVNLAAKEINGVAGLSNSGMNKLKRMFASNYLHGCKIDFEENRVSVDVFLNVFFGYSVNDVAYRVQENIKRSIESMTEFKSEQINIFVRGVVFNGSEEVAIV